MDMTCATPSLSTSPRLPAELLGLVFQYLPQSSLVRCLLVCRVWSIEASPYLYTHLELVENTKSSTLLKFRANRRNTRYLEWNSHKCGIDRGVVTELILNSWTTEATGIERALESGPNRATLYSFMFKGHPNQFPQFYHMLFSLKDLTRLSLEGSYFQSSKDWISLDTILSTMPFLLELDLTGFHYFLLDREHVSSLDLDRSVCRLRTFKFDVTMLVNSLPDDHWTPAFTHRQLGIFQRLGNLEHVCIREGPCRSTTLSRYNSNTASQVLHKCCPKLKSIEVEDFAPLELYSFTSPTKLTTTTTTTTTTTPTATTTTTATEIAVTSTLDTIAVPATVASKAPPLDYYADTPQEQVRVEEQQFRSWNDAKEFFPNLTFVRARSLAAEDLRCLAARAKYLTRVKITVWDKSKRESPDSQRQRRARPRSSITSVDMQIFLETCPNLKVFEVIGGYIYVEDMVPGPSSDGSDNVVLSRAYRALGCTRLKMTRFAKPWACERTLETLSIGFELACATPSDHRIIFAQLGRCQHLRNLTMEESNLIPTLKHGIDLLAGLKDTLERVHRWSAAYAFDDKETILWVLEHLPNLQLIGTNIYQGSGLQERIEAWIPMEHRSRFIYLPRKARP
ncbi:hypothetical protein B0O80DRAFT_502733 [Mortierella sp. GBAus27b]|nr:hypothetical protein BGX31_006615 [Mortierella sp. GBA43]KAI8347402.1 hypothetical protein B0O80DRAFT_502733 [Mortierella sp. GBAus27b]